jgi:DNA (cytosine-5)-methyltransferase 1
MEVAIGEFPSAEPYQHLVDVVNTATAEPLSLRAASGFWSRLSASNLGRHPGFREDMDEYVSLLSAELPETG